MLGLRLMQDGRYEDALQGELFLLFLCIFKVLASDLLLFSLRCLSGADGYDLLGSMK